MSKGNGLLAAARSVMIATAPPSARQVAAGPPLTPACHISAPVVRKMPSRLLTKSSWFISEPFSLNNMDSKA